MLTTLFATILLLGIAVIFHEFGHFIVAKILGIRVEQFSIGFPPRLVGLKIGETDYCISALPLGGYVKVTGQDPTEELTGADYEFNARPPWQRMLVVIAGPLMNIITAYFLIVIAIMIGVPTLSPVVDVVTPNSPAAKAGLQKGDTLTSVDGLPFTSLDRFEEILENKTGKNVTLRVTRGKESVTTQLQVPQNIDSTGIEFLLPAVIGVVQPNKPAARAGLQLNDEFVSVNGQPTEGRWQNVSKIIRAGKGEPLQIVIKRNGKLMNFTIKPEYSQMAKAPLIGVEVKPYAGSGVISYPLGQALLKGWSELLQQIVMFFSGIWMIIVGIIPVREALGGPQSIANIAGQYMHMGWSFFLLLTATISITLGIINLFPVPVLDGGHLLFHAIEWIRGKALTPKTWEVATKFGFAVLVTLMSFVVINDFIGSGTLSNILRQFH